MHLPIARILQMFIAMQKKYHQQKLMPLKAPT